MRLFLKVTKLILSFQREYIYYSSVSNDERLHDFQLVLSDLNMMILTKKPGKLKNAGHTLKVLFTIINLQIHLCFLFPFSL